MISYKDLIEQTFYFPTEEFNVQNNHLIFNDLDLHKVVEEFDTPLKITYLPKIGKQINKAKTWFRNAFEKHNYKGSYTYCYCIKSSQFQFVLNEALKNDIHLETSSAFDISIVREFYKEGKVHKDNYIICNGFKRPLYTDQVSALINDGFHNCIPILDHIDEIKAYEKNVTKDCKLGIRVATDEEQQVNFYTSRLGIRYNDIVPFYKEKIEKNPKFTLKILHFFSNTGIKDNIYFWSELNKFVEKYCELKKICPDLDAIDIGGGLPIKMSLSFEFDYASIIDQIIENIKLTCEAHDVPTPNIFTEFGSFTVGESGAVIYSVLDQKLQNDKELWYMIDSSFITDLPDVWGTNQRFIMMALNHWDKPYHKVNLGGLSCDSMDYYNSDASGADVFLPKFDKNTEPLYVGFFHTGAYQESLGGYGGIQHCLIPEVKHIIVDKDENGENTIRVFAQEGDDEQTLRILGFRQ